MTLGLIWDSHVASDFRVLEYLDFNHNSYDMNNYYDTQHAQQASLFYITLLVVGRTVWCPARVDLCVLL